MLLMINLYSKRLHATDKVRVELHLTGIGYVFGFSSVRRLRDRYFYVEM